MTPSESLTFNIFQLALQNIVTSGWDNTPCSRRHVGDHFRDALQSTAGNHDLPLEAHLLWWSMTDGLSASEFENEPGTTFCNIVEMITDSLYWLIDETAAGTEFLKSVTAGEGYNERHKRHQVLSVAPTRSPAWKPTCASLGEFDVYTPNLPQIGPIRAPAATWPANFFTAAVTPGPIIVSPQVLAQWQKIKFDPPSEPSEPAKTSFAPRCECGATATGSPAHSSWCPIKGNP